LDVEEVDEEAMLMVEDEANRQVYANRPIRAYFVSQDDLASVPLRRPPKVSGQIRIVEIEGHDFSACGGTHVARTGEIGSVRLVRRERSRGHVRVTFLCGWRALADAREKARLVNEIAALFSTDPVQAPALVARNLEQLKAADRRIQELSARLLTYEADRLWAEAPNLAGRRVVASLLPDQDPAGLKLLANLLQANPATIALLACPAGGDKLTVIFARSPDVDAAMGDLLRTTLQAFGGGGGGRPEYAQGGGAPADQAEALLDFAVEQLSGV
jgi:alanyl-tRNA synthetase